MTTTEATAAAREYLGGTAFPFETANQLWKELKRGDELSLARRVLERLRAGKGLSDDPTTDRAVQKKLCQQEALLTSKDRDLNAATRHDRALRILAEGLGSLDDVAFDGDRETLGIAGGILKRRWDDLGQIEDLRKAARYYERGAAKDLGEDGYAHINAAFMEDLLASVGDQPETRRTRATTRRMEILEKLTPADQIESDDVAWFNTATRAEALFGLKKYDDATNVIAAFDKKKAPWELETTARQIATLAHIHEPDPLAVPEIRRFFETLLPGAADAARSAVIGKVGLALSGGGFRASLYHLGVLAKLAELNVLRHVDVLSCVSGGSIVGACYWLALRRRMLSPAPLQHKDYIAIVSEVIDHFMRAVGDNLFGGLDSRWFSVLKRVFREDAKGALDPEETASALEEMFYRPLRSDKSATGMHDLPFTPRDHDAGMTGSEEFHPGKHNWLRGNKVPVLVLNATTVNTGHAWQFTPTWMGESPWAVHEGADSIPRLEWSWYVPEKNWSMPLGRAVAASASVPGIFTPLRINTAYRGWGVQLVDGGVHDNQGTVSLLALNCNVVLVSDACGQLMAEKEPGTGVGGLLSYADRSMSTLMERVRLANYADLSARKRSGLLRGLMFLHMKAGLDADTVRLDFSQEAYEITREPMSRAGIRKDFQAALAELRTHLDVFTPDECYALMACGYRMTKWAFERDLTHLKALYDPPVTADWPFKPMLDEITSTKPTTSRRDALLDAFRKGSQTRRP
jgi:predicted acylesterase/phospholipase RssA